VCVCVGGCVGADELQHAHARLRAGGSFVQLHNKEWCVCVCVDEFQHCHARLRAGGSFVQLHNKEWCVCMWVLVRFSIAMPGSELEGALCSCIIRSGVCVC